jgi:hypothetical protein
MPRPSSTEFPLDDAALEQRLEQDEHEKKAVLAAFAGTVQHFFGGWAHLFHRVADPRMPALILYPVVSLALAGILMYATHLKARRQIGLQLRGNGSSADHFRTLTGVAACPHGDTVNAAFKRMNPDEFQAIVTGMTETLIRQKVLYRYRLLERYFLVVVDGTGRLTFPERHCSHCLTATHGGQTIYYHPVLEAKLVTFDGLVFSLLTEFIENPGEFPKKQDCELKAFYRLAERLKQRFPRLPICLLLDGLYAGGPTFAVCDKYRWKYIIVLQEGGLSTVHQEFEALLHLAPENHLRSLCVPAPSTDRMIQQDLRWVNQIAYVDTERREHTVSVLECLETTRDEDGQPQTTRFKWVTNFTVTAKRVTTLANEGGRLRWKIENEGFNVQKNGGFELEHVYSQDPTASKIFYFLLQMAHTLLQLVEHGSLFRKVFPAGVGSSKNIAVRLLEAWRNVRLSLAEWEHCLTARFQIRLDTS